MKCISLTQPWASLIILGIKRYETRSWPTSFRGRIAIHASKSCPAWAREFRNESPCSEELARKGITGTLPLGCVLGFANLSGCERTEEIMSMWRARAVDGHILFADKLESQFGDFSEGRFAFRMENAKPFKEPIPARGALGLWEWHP